MRELLFRGKTKEGHWIEGLPYYNYGNGEWFISHSNGWVPSYNNPDEGEHTIFSEVDPETICEFTGKTTKNKSLVYYEVEKLFEDDIFRIGKDKTKYRCVFENYEWVGISNEGDKYGPYAVRLAAINCQIHIVGNIHDNPELLK